MAVWRYLGQSGKVMEHGEVVGMAGKKRNALMLY